MLWIGLLLGLVIGLWAGWDLRKLQHERDEAIARLTRANASRCPECGQLPPIRRVS